MKKNCSLVSLFEVDLGNGDFLGKSKRHHDCVAIDCEMVGVGADGKDSALARVSIVDFFGKVLLDEYVRPSERITDYRTWVSGIRPHHVLGQGKTLAEVQKAIATVIKPTTLLIGHSLQNDFKVRIYQCRIKYNNLSSLISHLSSHLSSLLIYNIPCNRFYFTIIQNV